MKALKNIVKNYFLDNESSKGNLEDGNSQSGEGNLKDNILDYIMYTLPILIFFIIGIFCIPWIVNLLLL